MSMVFFCTGGSKDEVIGYIVDVLFCFWIGDRSAQDDVVLYEDVQFFTG